MYIPTKNVVITTTASLTKESIAVDHTEEIFAMINLMAIMLFLVFLCILRMYSDLDTLKQDCRDFWKLMFCSNGRARRNNMRDVRRRIQLQLRALAEAEQRTSTMNIIISFAVLTAFLPGRKTMRAEKFCGNLDDGRQTFAVAFLKIRATSNGVLNYTLKAEIFPHLNVMLDLILILVLYPLDLGQFYEEVVEFSDTESDSDSDTEYDADDQDDEESVDLDLIMSDFGSSHFISVIVTMINS